MTPGSDAGHPDGDATNEADDQDVAEALDSDVTEHEDDEDGDYPLDRALGVTDYGTAPDEEATPESWARRSARENPEVGMPGAYHGDPDAVPGLTAPDDLDPGDGELLGDRVDDPELPSAEEAAMHLTDEEF